MDKAFSFKYTEYLAFQEEYEAHSKGTTRKKLCMLSKCEITGLQNNHNETHLTD